MAKININFNPDMLSADYVISQRDLTKDCVTSELKNIEAQKDYSRLKDFAFESFPEVRNKLLKEIDHHFTFVLLTIVESWFRSDFINRVNNKPKHNLPNLTKSCRKLFDKAHKNKKKPYEIKLKDIIGLWREEFPSTLGETDVLNQYIEELNFRNWYAHGRYWDVNFEGRKYNFENVSNIVQGIRIMMGDELTGSARKGNKDIEETLIFTKI